MNVLLGHGYFLKEDKVEESVMMPYPPQGLLHITTYLKTKNIDCEIFDSTFSSYDELCDFLLKNKPRYLGLYVNLMTRVNIVKMLEFIKNSEELDDIVVILGGPDVSYHTGKYLDRGADYCITGEGEHTFYRLIMHLEGDKKGPPASIPGISYRDENNETVYTGEPGLIENIDELPFPDFGLIDIEPYFSTWKENHGFTSMTISTMRGCPYSCRWCSKAVFGKTFRRRSPEMVVGELEKLQKRYNPDRYWIVDDVFTISKEWLKGFTDEIKSRGLEISYECVSRADRMDDEVIALLKESGCNTLWIGAESGSQKVLDLMDRRVEAARVRDMIKATKRAGIESGTFLMLGYPGETEKDIVETAKHLRDSLPDLLTITMAYPIPGTALYAEAEKAGLKVPGEWGCYTDREIDFRRTYRRTYYTHAIRYLHHSAKAGKALANRNMTRGVKHSLICNISRVLMAVSK